MGQDGDNQQAVQRLYEAAADVGRLRLRLDPEPGGLLEWTLDRLGGHISAAIGIFEPTAADLVAWTFPGDPATITAAIEHVDSRHARLRRALGYRRTA